VNVSGHCGNEACADRLVAVCEVRCWQRKCGDRGSDCTTDKYCREDAEDVSTNEPRTAFAYCPQWGVRQSGRASSSRSSGHDHSYWGRLHGDELGSEV